MDYFNYEKLIIKGFYINYEAGFIRRGLFGSILLLLAKNISINPFKFQIIFEVILIAFLIYLIIKDFYKYKIQPYILFGSFMLLNIIAYKMFFTLDVFMFMFFILQMNLINKINTFNIKIITINLTSIFMILIHEAYFIFTFFPILYLLNVNSLSAQNIKNLFLLFPSFIVFLLVGICFNGFGVDINFIINSWGEFGTMHLKEIGELYWVFNSSDEVIMWKIPIFKSHPIYLLGFLLNTIMIFFCMLIYLNKNFQSKSNNIFTFLMCQYIAIILVSLIAVDYVRWFWLSNIITIFTLIYVKTNNGFLKIVNLKLTNKLYSVNKFILLFIGLPLGASWSPTQFIYTMPIKHFFDFGKRFLLLF